MALFTQGALSSMHCRAATDNNKWLEGEELSPFRVSDVGFTDLSYHSIINTSDAINAATRRSTVA